MNNRLVLTEDTLRVVMALLPTAPLCGELIRARDFYPGSGSLVTAEIRQISRALSAASAAPTLSAAHVAMRAAGAELRDALRQIDVDALDALGCQEVRVVMRFPVLARSRA